MADIKAEWNIYQKLQDVRNKIAKMNISKTGFNSHFNYAYYALGDFEAQATELFNSAGLCPVYNIVTDQNGLEIASLTLHSGPETISFRIPTAEVPKMEGVFELGAKDTYCLRYLLVRHVLMLPENDVAEDTHTDDRPTETKATEKQLSLLQNLYDAENIAKMLDYYGADTLSDLTLQQASEAIQNKRK